jgi:copper oxidase (laccase) domain-containing protein
VHGSRVVVTDRPCGPLDEEADGLVSTDQTAVLAMLGADCALIGLSSPEGVIGVVHAGWRGLVAGVVEEATRTMCERGATRIEAVLGPMIGVECYPFSPADLDLVVARYGPGVAGTDVDGADALDLRAAVTEALSRAQVPVVAELGGCTACDGRFYSWRGRRDSGRHALAIGGRSGGGLSIGSAT